MPDPLSPADPIVVQLEPSGPGPTLRERLVAAAGRVAGDVRLEVRAVVVAMIPVADARPPEVKWRRALKAMARNPGCALRADWNAKAGRPPPRPKPRMKCDGGKPTKSRRAGRKSLNAGPNGTVQSS